MINNLEDGEVKEEEEVVVEVVVEVMGIQFLMVQLHQLKHGGKQTQDGIMEVLEVVQLNIQQMLVENQHKMIIIQLHLLVYQNLKDTQAVFQKKD